MIAPPARPPQSPQGRTHILDASRRGSANVVGLQVVRTGVGL